MSKKIVTNYVIRNVGSDGDDGICISRELIPGEKWVKSDVSAGFYRWTLYVDGEPCSSKSIVASVLSGDEPSGVFEIYGHGDTVSGSLVIAIINHCISQLGK